MTARASVPSARGWERQPQEPRQTRSILRAVMEHVASAAVGPWLMTIVALLAIEQSTTNLITEATLTEFRLTVIYAFGLSMIATTPVLIVAVRLLSDDLHAEAIGAVRPLFVVTLLLSVVASSIAAAATFGYLGLPLGQAWTSMIVCALAGQIWVALAFASVMKDYGGITSGFLVGLLVGMAGAVAGAAYTQSPIWMLFGFSTGLSVVVLWLTLQIVRQLPRHTTSQDGPDALIRFAAAARRYRLLVVGASLSAVGLWIDKVLTWISPHGERVGYGLIHAPLYDSPIFAASLLLAPALALFVTALETRFFGLYRAYFDGIANHATLAEIRRLSAAVSSCLIEVVGRILMLQAVLSVIVVLAAPAIIESMHFQFQQVAILRWGAIGAVFQFLFLASTSILIFTNQYAKYAGLQLAFLLLNGTFTLVTIRMDNQLLGMGYFAASLICGLTAFGMALRTLSELEYLTFIVHNADG